MRPLRIALFDTPPMLTAILKDIVDAQPDLEYGGSVSLQSVLDGMRPETVPDVLVVGVTEPDNSALARRMLVASPGIRVVMIARDGKRAVLYELYPVRTEIEDVSPQGLVEAIRRGAPSVH